MSKKISFLPKAGGTRVFETDADRLLDDIVLAIPSIPTTEYTQDNKPRVEMLEQLLGEDITEAQRDEAFKIFKIKSGTPHVDAPLTTEPDQESAETTGDDNEAD